VAFAPGQSVLPDPVPAHLLTVAQALRERPGLQLDLLGHGDVATDTAALQAAAPGTAITEADLIGLGNRRSEAVRDWLAGPGGIDAARIFLRAGRPGGGTDPAAPATRVDFEFR
jgi:outer membrane protein OmpA-like peptidoglycan-associated protein